MALIDLSGRPTIIRRVTTSSGLRRRTPERGLVVGLGAAVLLMAAAHAVVPNQPWAPAWAEHDNEVRRFFEVAGEQNGWTWLNVVILATAALLHAGVGWLSALDGRRWWPWGLTALLLAGLSLDDLTALHERLHDVGVALGGGSGPLRAAWVVPGAAVAVGVATGFLLLARELPRRPRTLLLAGLALLLGSALGMEALSQSVLDSTGPSSAYGVLVLLEEVAEAAGAVLLAASPVAAVAVSTAPGRLDVRLEKSPGESGSPAA